MTAQLCNLVMALAFFALLVALHNPPTVPNVRGDDELPPYRP